MLLHMRALRVGLGTANIDALAAQIQRMEGYYPPGTPNYPQGSLAYQNNNPGNLVYAGQAGATKSCSSNGYCYAKFPTYDDGYAALLNQINGQAAKGQDLQQFINQYAPPCPKAGDTPNAQGICPDGTRGNDTSAYLSSLQAATGASANTPLTSIISGDAGSGDSTQAVYDASVDTSGDGSGGDTTTMLVVGGVVALGAWLAFGR